MMRKSPRYPTSSPTGFYLLIWDLLAILSTPLVPKESTEQHMNHAYCWWLKSCTIIIIYKVSYIPGGAIFQPSTLSFHITSEIAIQKFEWIVIWRGFSFGSTPWYCVALPRYATTTDTHGKTCTQLLFQSDESKTTPYDLLLCPTHSTEESSRARLSSFT